MQIQFPDHTASAAPTLPASPRAIRSTTTAAAELKRSGKPTNKRVDAEPPWHVFHATGVHQTRLHPVLFQHIVRRYLVHPRALHRHCGDPVTHQPLSHLFQIFGEG
jgi:hypothetical protein